MGGKSEKQQQGPQAHFWGAVLLSNMHRPQSTCTGSAEQTPVTVLKADPFWPDEDHTCAERGQPCKWWLFWKSSRRCWTPGVTFLLSESYSLLQGSAITLGLLFGRKLLSFLPSNKGLRWDNFKDHVQLQNFWTYGSKASQSISGHSTASSWAFQALTTSNSQCTTRLIFTTSECFY